MSGEPDEAGVCNARVFDGKAARKVVRREHERPLLADRVHQPLAMLFLWDVVLQVQLQYGAIRIEVGREVGEQRVDAELGEIVVGAVGPARTARRQETGVT